jgi:hypothetical protein
MNKIYIILLLILIFLVYIHNYYNTFENNSQSNTKLKIGICFFGLCRSTHHTAESIKTNIYTALNNLNIDYDIYLHTYKIDKEYNNKWSGESNETINNDNWKLLNPTNFLIENEDDVIKELDLLKYRTHGDPWSWIGDGSFKTLDNAILSLYSTYQVTQLWKNSNIQYDAILYLRPDVIYYKPLLLSYFYPPQKNTILLPDFEEWPVNDRLAIGPPDVMEIYGNRFLGAYEYSLTNQLHTETYLNYVLNKNNITVKKFHFNFSRVKINGENREPWLYEAYYNVRLFLYNFIG